MLVPKPSIAAASIARRTATQNRAFFGLSGLTPPETPPQTYHERKILPYSRSELYDVVADVASYPAFLPFCTGARILTRSEHPLPVGSLADTAGAPPRKEVRMDAELVVAFLSFKESYVSKVTCRPDESVEADASSSTPLFKTLKTLWRLQPASPRSPHPTARDPLLNPTPASLDGPADSAGPTLLTLDLSYAFANPLYAAVSSAFFSQISRQMVEAFEQRCIDLYGPGRS
ncbi:hypothetical protein EWM64_g9130 [Hericium alpestre]|uniref:Coenzyme Q-binding protein COQ10 START domain-containing protein n=1 Tax=Hericium alpestre TaxID=135208 RepID=A0A4Y9ZJI8_9AGAM|nr:hypothetical protein EWM64_g9130 [Hericium alpestre]